MFVRLVFDRGTLVCLDAADPAALRGVAGLLWDGRVRVWRAPAYRHSEIAEQLRERGFEVRDEVRPSARDPTGPWRGVELRPYQEAALAAWTLSGRRGLVVLPTGSGKTRVAVAAMARTHLATLCIVPTRVLMHQWRAELGRFLGALVGALGDGERDLQPVTVATIESAWRDAHRLGARFDLLVVDEAHHFGSGVKDEALEMSVAHSRLGLTATPPPSEGDAADRLTQLVGPTVYQLAIGDLAGRYLADFDVVTLHLPLDREERAAYESDRATFREPFVRFRQSAPLATWSDFVRLASSSADGRAALAAWRRSRRLLGFTRAKAAALATLLARHRDSRMLIFTADNRAAYAIAREHLVMPLTCDIGRAERDEALGRFRRGELHALVSAQVLNEGLDVPDADVAIVVAGSAGEREHVQRVGRLLRPVPGKRALVYELVTARTTEVWQARRRRRGLVAVGAATP